MKKSLYFILILFSFTIYYTKAESCNLNYTVASTTYAPVISYYAGTEVQVVADTFSDAIPIGFTFNFYGNYFSSVVVSPNGFLTFDTSQAGNFAFRSVNFSNTISLFEQDHPINPWVSGTINHITTGTTPNRMFVVSFDSIYINGTYSTGQVVLYEGSNAIDMFIASATPASGAMLQGIEYNNSQKIIVTGRDTTDSWSATNDGQRFTPFNEPYTALASICMATVDSASGKNMVIWNKPSGIPIDSFIIYKETSDAGDYTAIGAQHYNEYSTFIDTGSHPAQQANRYRLGFRDSCGMLSDLSEHHKTIHLAINQGIGGALNLAWDAYEGANYSRFNIYRGTSPSDLTLLLTIASNLFSYTDLNPSSGNVYYAIGIDVGGGCNPTARTSILNSTLSNIVVNSTTGLESLIDESSIRVFPNPVSRTANIQLKLNAKTDLAIQMSDLTGRIVYSDIYKNASNLIDQQIDCSALSRGIYFLQIKADMGSYNRKVVVE